MCKIFLKILICVLIISYPLSVFSQPVKNKSIKLIELKKSNMSDKSIENECSEVFNYKNYKKINTPSYLLNYDDNEFPKLAEGWTNLMSENFEGSFPSNKWNVYAATGYTDAYWGIVEASVGNHAVWCAASGSAAVTYGYGYANTMNTWMVYGPFDLSDASDASLDFYYYNSSEPGYDKFEWMASDDGIYFHGYYLSDTSNSTQFQLKSLDLKNVPTLGNLTGKNGIYIAFIFLSDSLISNYWGALVDNITLKKYTSFVYPSTISLSKNFSFSDASKSSSYRMISLPGISNISLGDAVSGTQKNDWNAYYDNGASTNYLEEYDGTSKFTFSPGKGFWVLSKNAINISKSINTVSLTSNSYSISLHSGWNIISNPFERDVSWSSIQTANGLSVNSIIYSWNGTWSNPAALSVYGGYYFNNTQNLSTLIIPYNPNGSIGKSPQINIPNYSVSKSIHLELYTGDKKLSEACISINPESSNDFDELDYFSPPGDFDEARVEVINENLSTVYKKLFIETRPKIENGQKFYINIKNNLNSELNLKLSGVENFNDYEVCMVNETLNESYNLKIKSEIRINPNTKDKYYLAIGTQDFVKSIAKNLIPQGFCLYQNYPNPFNPVTTIKYDIPKASHVMLKIYDIIGNEVETLVNKVQQAGNYKVQVVLGNKQFASGVYFYKLKAGGYIQTKKMVILK